MDIDVMELKSRLDKGEHVILIDVREPFEHAGFNIGGKLIPMGQFPAAIEELEPYQEEEIVLYCRSGHRSGIAKQVLQQAGFKRVRNLLGGMIAWTQAFGVQQR
jgi:rhodanese-related sulfurtransferase